MSISSCLRFLAMVIVGFGSQNTAAAQGALLNGEVVTGSVTGSNVATWTFSAAKGNFTVCAGVSIQGVPDSRFAPWLIIYNPDGTVLRGASGNIAVRSCSTPLPQTGTYSVTVRNRFGAQYPNLTTSFTLTLALPSKPYVVPNDSGGGAMAPGAVYNGAITLASIGQWSFAANQGDRLTVTMTDPANNPNFAPWVVLYGPDGAELTGTFKSTTATVVHTAPQTGTYTVLAFDTSPTVIASYTLTATGMSALPADGKTDGVPCCQSGDPINVATGSLFEQVTDYTTGTANPLAFTRYYNSRSMQHNTYPTALGVNWRSDYDCYLRLVSPAAVMAERADGQVINFYLQSGLWKPDSDIDLKLVQSGSVWTLTDRDDTVETYAAIGGKALLQSIRTRNGYIQTLSYDGQSLLQSVTDTYGRSLALANQGGLLHSVTTPDGLIVTYGYQSAGSASLLQSVTYSTTPATHQSYLYQSASLPMLLTGIADENGARYVSWTFDGLGRATSSQHAGGADLTTITYDDATGNRTVANGLGQQTVYKFATLQNVPKVTEIDRAASASTAAATSMAAYDSNGYLASRTDWNGNRTTYVNDVRGQPTSITEGAGTAQARTVTITYDAAFHLPVKIVESGLTTEFTYDSAGELLTRTETDTTTTTVPYSTNGTKRVWTYTWSNALLASIKGPRTDVAQVTRFSYDGAALVQVTNTLGQITRITQHNAGGLPQTIVDANGVTTQLTYDARQRLIGSTVNTATGARATNYTYDAAGNLLSVILPDGSALTNSYDAAHRLTGIKDILGQSVAYTLDAFGNRTKTAVLTAGGAVSLTHSESFDALARMAQDTGGAGQVTRYAYDDNGNTLTVTDPLNRVTRQAFDSLDRLVNSTDPANGITLITYDAHDRPLSVTAPNGSATTYVYNGFANRIQTLSSDTGKTVYSYDPAGNLTQKVDATGTIANYTYDALDRIKTVSYPAAPAENITYNYDQAGHGFGAGRLTSMSDPAGTLSRSYDEQGNITAETRLHGTVSLQTSYSYDTAGRIASITYPSGAVVAQGRDAMGRITSLSLKPKNATTAKSVLSAINWQPFGPVLSTTFGNNVAETRTFDHDYRLINLKDVGAAVVQNLTYAYNAADDVLSITDGFHTGKNQTLGYDALDRLITGSGAYGALSYAYDANGNRTKDGSTVYAYTANSNRLSAVGARGVTTNASGNITQLAAAGAIPAVNIAYYNSGRLATASNGSQSSSMTYDGFGQRLAQVGSATGQTFWQYDQAGRLLETTDNTGAAQVDYIYLEGRPVATFEPGSGKTYFLHDDRLGTPQLATDAGQGIAWSADYQPFGHTSTGIGLIAQDLRLPGQELEIETGWNHNGFRDYVPTLGRYLESDPIGLDGGSNTYNYGGQNPFKNIDPSGLQNVTWVPPGDPDHQQALAYEDPSYITVGAHGYGKWRFVWDLIVDSRVGRLFSRAPAPAKVAWVYDAIRYFRNTGRWFGRDFIQGPDGGPLSVEQAGNAILQVIGKSSETQAQVKPIQFGICYAGAGGQGSFANQVLRYVAQRRGSSVQGRATPGLFTLDQMKGLIFVDPAVQWIQLKADPGR